ncbi:MAG TPA: NADPH-dependent FMN reductase [Candidatus Saccharimonadales bacterium]|nr:NADPH-dependent FMN reductase [Candidatus Saccharimonadales bacterium]
MKLMVIWGSSRQGRNGGVVAEWVRRHATADNRLELDFVDLREVKLPFFDEPLSPFAMASENKPYTHPEGQAWAERVSKTEGVLIVTPEYNHGPPAVLKNALDWVGREWLDKPVAFVSYGSTAGGARAVEQLRSVTIELGLIQVANPIHFFFYRDAFDEQGEPKHTGTNDSLAKMFDELIRLHSVFAAAKSANKSAGGCGDSDS